MAKPGKYVKNPEVVGSSTGAIRVPVGSSADRPTAPINGQLRYNTTDNVMEMYVNGAWAILGVVGLVTITKDTFTGDGSTTAYTMSISVANVQDIIVHVGNVHQNPDVAYTVSGTTLTFTSPPPETHTIIVQHGYNSTSA
tara:strand:- start:215 stop:634 length:420 start_codon:yes stop_codon:yes gene_type:complete